MKKIIVFVLTLVIVGVSMVSAVHMIGSFNAGAAEITTEVAERVTKNTEALTEGIEVDSESYENTSEDTEVCYDDYTEYDTGSDEAEEGWYNTESADEKMIDVPGICQYPELPTGCESVSATMVMQYYNSAVTETEFASQWLKCNNNFHSVLWRDYGPDPDKEFAGDPFSEYSYGCYAGPIVEAINNNSSVCRAEKITGRTLEELCDEYIDNDMPLLIWATMYMKESYKSASWYLDDGSKFTWTAQEHCMVLVGYDEDNYYLNDPLTGTTVSYEKELVQQRFEELGSQAVCISPVEE